MSRLKDAIERYKVNNRGQLPVFSSVDNNIMELQFARSYLQVNKGEFKDPSGKDYMIRSHPNIRSGFISGSAPISFDLRIYIFTEAKCNGSRLENTDGSNRYTIQLRLEGGGVYCIDG